MIDRTSRVVIVSRCIHRVMQIDSWIDSSGLEVSWLATWLMVRNLVECACVAPLTSLPRAQTRNLVSVGLESAPSNQGSLGTPFCVLSVFIPPVVVIILTKLDP